MLVVYVSPRYLYFIFSKGSMRIFHQPHNGDKSVPFIRTPLLGYIWYLFDYVGPDFSNNKFERGGNNGI